MLTIYNVFYVLYLLENLLFRGRLEKIGVFFNNKTYELEYNSEVIGYVPKV